MADSKTGMDGAMPNAAPTRDERLWGWVQLVRPPNLFTVPGDVVAGVAFGMGTLDFRGVGPTVALAVGASLLLYMGGLILNDWCDRAVDAIERPKRPIPSGAVPASQALAAAVACLVLGVVLATLAAPMAGGLALLLAACVVLYNSWAKTRPAIGIPVMAACRGLNILLGAAAVEFAGRTPAWVLPATAATIVYFLLVSKIAYHEMERLPSKGLLLAVALFPLPVLVTGAGRLTGEGCPFVWVIWILLVLNTTGIVKAMWANTNIARTPPFIGMLIRNLVFMQAFWVAAGGGFCFWVVGVLALWPLGGWFGKWFYAS